jgi:hypothetical protein
VRQKVEKIARNLTNKFADDGRTKPEPRPGKEPLPAPVENMCLVRATCRSKKISTVVRIKLLIFKKSALLAVFKL